MGFDWTAAGVIFAIFSGIVTGGYVVARMIIKAIRDRAMEEGAHGKVHETMAEDIHGAHEGLRAHDIRISKLEKTTGEISGKLDQALANQGRILDHLMDGKKA